MDKKTKKRLEANEKETSKYFKMDTLGTGFALMLNKATTTEGIEIITNFKGEKSIPDWILKMALTDKVYNTPVLAKIMLLFTPEEINTDNEMQACLIGFCITVLENYTLEEYEDDAICRLLNKLLGGEE